MIRSKPRKAMYKPQTGSMDYLASEYSLMKHGCIDSIRYFSVLFSQFILRHVDDNKEYCLLSSSYRSVPNAANQLLKAMLPHLGERFHYSLLLRRRITPVDFATLPRWERPYYVGYLDFDFDKRALQGRSVIIIDDAYVTGAHERAITSRLHAVVGELQCFYLLDLSRNKHATIESEINHAAVGGIMDLLPLRAHPQFQYNTRALKLLFTASDHDFLSYIAELPTSELALIKLHSVRDGFDRVSKAFKKRQALLQDMIDSSDMVSKLGLAGLK